MCVGRSGQWALHLIVNCNLLPRLNQQATSHLVAAVVFHAKKKETFVDTSQFFFKQVSMFFLRRIIDGPAKLHGKQHY